MAFATAFALPQPHAYSAAQDDALLLILGQALHHVAFEIAGRDRVDANVAGSEFAGQAAGQAVQLTRTLSGM